MKPIKKYTFLCILILSSLSVNATKQKLSLKEAAEKGFIDYRLSGTDGSHYGDCMGLLLESNSDSDLVLDVAAGTELVPVNHKYQTMIVTRNDEFQLPANGIKSYNIYAMCGEYYDEPPIATTIYGIGEISQKKNVAKMARYIDFSAKQNYKGQYAIWAVADQITNKDLKKYGATNIDINDVLDMTDEVNIPVKLTRTIIKKEKIEKKVKTLTKKISSEVKIVKPQKPEKIIEETAGQTALRKYGYHVIGGIVLMSAILGIAIRVRRTKIPKV